ncbi:hypothetical protein LshimejAT787_1900240 [Lyophyllum shimeji]|uniref:Uncharacterized protein n=1 Tax=Lyophyllum shimeji TaxID=47721 RepID=A0A9P3Q0C9_LYOSH|nr:hypothetical protein LshimejAT787_1900240 [Lyophyllum shimeji]
MTSAGCCQSGAGTRFLSRPAPGLDDRVLDLLGTTTVCRTLMRREEALNAPNLVHLYSARCPGVSVSTLGKMTKARLAWGPARVEDEIPV